MTMFSVFLGIDRAARDTGRRVRMTVAAPDRLSAAIEAEAMVDLSLSEPDVMYSHAMSAVPIVERQPTATACAA